MSENEGRLVILSGPSCVGKTPLWKALKRFYPDLAAKLRPLVLYNSRAPRPGEQSGVDYHFRTREQVEAMRGEGRYVVLEVRGDLQAVDLDDLSAVLKGGDAVFEGNPFVGRLLQTHASLGGVRRLGIFISPLTKDEIVFLRGEPQVSLADLVRDVMRRKLLRRTRRQKGEPSLKDLEEIERRAGSAYAELAEAKHFDHVIPNHDGEDSDHWDAFYYPLGDARRTLLAVVGLLRGETPAGVERWDADCVPAVRAQGSPTAGAGVD
jgi:guanylate kinase